jgi:hypothetical protein
MFNYISVGTCIDNTTCDTGNYYKNSSVSPSTCDPCHSTCASCVGENSDKCKTCILGTDLIKRTSSSNNFGIKISSL